MNIQSFKFMLARHGVMRFARVCSICILILMIIAMSLCVASYMSVVFRNNLMLIADLLEYVCNSDHDLHTWEFSPSTIDWCNTNQISKVEFSPLRARRHQVFIEFKTKLGENDTLHSKDLTALVSNAMFRMLLYHQMDGKTELFENRRLTDFSQEWCYPNKDEVVYRVVLMEFFPTDYPWDFNDKILMTIQLLNERNVSKKFRNIGKIKVGEYYPLY